MTKQEAINAAKNYIERELLKVRGFHSVQYFTASQLPEHLRNRNDYWIVRFYREIPEEVVESPSLIMVEVDDTSGQVSGVDSL